MLELNKNKKSVESLLSADQGWSHMSDLLDQELPTSPKSPLALYWSIGAVCLVSLGLLLFMYTPKTVEPIKATPQIKMEAPVKSPKQPIENREIAIQSNTINQPTEQLSITTTKEKQPLINNIQADQIAKSNAKAPTNHQVDHVTKNNAVVNRIAVSSVQENSGNSTKIVNSKYMIGGAGAPFSINNQLIVPTKSVAQVTSLKNKQSNLTVKPSDVQLDANNRIIEDNAQNGIAKQLVASDKVEKNNALVENRSPEASKNNLVKFKNLKLSDSPNLISNVKNNQFTLSHSTEKEIEFLPAKMENSIAISSSTPNTSLLSEINPKTKPVNLGLFVGSTYGLIGTVGGRAGLSASTKLAHQFSLNLDPTYSYTSGTSSNPKKEDQTTTNSYTAINYNSHEVSLPAYVMYHPNRLFGVSLGVFAGFQNYSSTLKNNGATVFGSTVDQDSLEVLGPGKFKMKPSLGALLGVHWFVKPKLRVNLGYENRLATYNKNAKFLKNSQITLGVGYSIL